MKNPTKERPILMSTPMVQAVLDGRKIMTRRVAKISTDFPLISSVGENGGVYAGRYMGDMDHEWFKCPYGKVGDRLCPLHYGIIGDKEQFSHNGSKDKRGGLVEADSGGNTERCSCNDRLWVKESFYAYGKYRYTGKLTKNGKREVEFFDCTQDANGTYRYVADESIPKPKSRFEFDWHRRPSIFMPREASRINLEITGVRVERLQEITEEDANAEGFPDTFRRNGSYESTELGKWKFIELWDSLNAKRGFGWDVNPWVWVIEFKVI